MAVRVKRRRSLIADFFITALWMLPLLAILLFGGFWLGKEFIAPRILGKAVGAPQSPQARRILSPEEAAKIARDQPSRVWEEGVKDSDIPELPDDPEMRPRRTVRRRTTAPAPPATTETITPADETPADGNEPPAIVPAPDFGTE